MIGATAVLVTRDDGSSPHVAAPRQRLSARVVTARAVDATIGRVRDAPARRCSMPTRRAARTAVTSGPRRCRRRATTAAPTGCRVHARRADRRHPRDRRRRTSRPRSISIADGEGARWALDPQPPGHRRHPARHVPQAHRTRSAIRCRTQLRRSTPTRSGPIAAVGGAVWVPVRDGVLQFDAADGTSSRHLALPAAAHRWVALVGQGCVRDRRWHAPPARPRAGLADRIDLGPEIIGLAATGFDSRVLLRNEQGGTDRARGRRRDRGRPRARRPRRCPPGSTPTASRRRRRGCGPPAPSTVRPRSCCSTTTACTPPSCSTTRRDGDAGVDRRRAPSPRSPTASCSSFPCPEATTDVPRRRRHVRRRTSTTRGRVMRKPSVILVALVMFALVAGACGGGRDVSIDTNRPRPELLYLGSRTAITAISPAQRPRPLPGGGRGPEPRLVGALRRDQRRHLHDAAHARPGHRRRARVAHAARRLRRARRVGGRRRGGAEPTAATGLRHLPPDDQGPDPARDRAPRRPRAAGALGARATWSPRRSRSKATRCS